MKKLLIASLGLAVGFGMTTTATTQILDRNQDYLDNRGGAELKYGIGTIGDELKDKRHYEDEDVTVGFLWS